MALMGETGNHHRSPLGSSRKGGMGRSGSFRILSENTSPHSPPVPLFCFIQLYLFGYINPAISESPQSCCSIMGSKSMLPLQEAMRRLT